jgi:hypothetical protein
LIPPPTGSVIDIRHKATSYRAYPDDSAPFKYSIELRNRRLLEAIFLRNHWGGRNAIYVMTAVCTTAFSTGQQWRGTQRVSVIKALYIKKTAISLLINRYIVGISK